MPDDAEFLSVQDVAAKLDVSETTVRRMVTDGQLEAIRVRRQIRIPKSSFSYLISQSVQILHSDHNHQI